MDPIIVLARVTGLMCLLIALSVFNRKSMSAIINDLERSIALFWSLGFLAALLGIIILSLYSTWSMQWTVLITILGWLALLKGIIAMLFPGSLAHSVLRRFKNSGIIMFSGIVSLIFGLVLLYKGFGW